MNKLHTLHILNKAPDHARFSECLGTMGPDDAIALTENGVLGLSASAALKTARVYALATDLNARGLSEPKDATAIDCAELVNLSLKAERVISW